jgi:hypothetical protein
MRDTCVPVSLVLKVFWKCFIAMMEVIREPSYPFAQAHMKATKMDTVIFSK